MAFQRIVNRTLPDGSTAKVFPFHISLEGLESTLLCRDEEDYDHLEKSFYLSAWKNNCIVVIEIAMSNHGHGCVLSPEMANAVSMAEMIKKRQSQYISWKYGETGIMSQSQVDIRYLDSDSYVRNTLAYIPRNAQDANCRIEDYRWSGYRGMFVQGRCPAGIRRVADLTRRERERLFRTHEDLSSVPWLLNLDGGVEPASACDWQYLEDAFLHDQAFFLKTLGALNVSEMKQKLLLNGRIRHTDTEMMAIISNLADRWYQRSVPELTPEMKARLLPYLYRGVPDKHPATGSLSPTSKRCGFSTAVNKEKELRRPMNEVSQVRR